MKMILLPGMDGSGNLFSSMLAYMPAEYGAKVYPLSKDSNQSIEAHVARLVSELAGQDVVLVAESFSGRIAYELCFTEVRVHHVVFIASFLSKPSVLANVAPFLPVWFLRKPPLPSFWLSWLCFGHGKQQACLNEVFRSLNSVPSAALKSRLRVMAHMQAPKRKTSVSCTYIRALRDRLITTQAESIIEQVFTCTEYFSIDCGHFVAQGEPEACGRIIAECTADCFKH